MKCPNCNSKMGCSCQKRVTAKGKIGCTKCIVSLVDAENNEVDNKIDNLFKKLSK